LADLCDRQKTRADSRRAALWEPGGWTGCRGWAFGYIMGEFVHRATGKPSWQILREDVAGPLGVAGRTVSLACWSPSWAGWPGWRTPPGSVWLVAAMLEDSPLPRAGPRPGSGASYACAEVATGVAIAFTKNRLTTGFDTATRLVEIVTRAGSLSQPTTSKRLSADFHAQ
jgi:hypothetical protein